MDARFLRACTTEAELPDPDLPEVAVAGRSNCGKSSLLNAVAGRTSLARTSSTPGRTQQIVFFEVAFPGSSPFCLVDLPGYGYAKASKEAQRRWSHLVERYIETRSTLRVVLLLLDLRRHPEKEEQDLLAWAEQRALLPLVVLTKADKVSKSQRFGSAERARRELGLEARPLIFSIDDAQAVVELRAAIADALQRQE